MTENSHHNVLKTPLGFVNLKTRLEKVVVEDKIDPRKFIAEIRDDPLFSRYVIKVVKYWPEYAGESLRVPASLWDHFKSRLPVWLRRRLKINYTIYTARAVILNSEDFRPVLSASNDINKDFKFLFKKE